MVIPTDVRLKYSQDFTSLKPIVISVDDVLLSQMYSRKVHIKSDSSGECFICDDSKTYRIRQAENSNTQLLIKPDEEVSEILGQFTGIVVADIVHVGELSDEEIQPLFDKFVGSVNLIAKIAHATIWSNAKIEEHLRKLDRYFIKEGHWTSMLIDEYYALQSGILNTCAIVGQSSSQSADSPHTYNSEDVWTGLNDIISSEGKDLAICLSQVQYMLSRFSPDNDPSYMNKGESEWPLNISIEPEKVLKFRGRHILHSRFAGQTVATPMNVERFISDLRDILVTTVTVDPDLIENDDRIREVLPKLLYGVGVLDDGLIIPLEISKLPIQLDERISELLKIKSTWEKNEFESFIAPILHPGIKPETLLLKTCRLDQHDNGLMNYSSKF
jgi:predicted DNA-binding ArsR family transcriptional regulator